MQTLSIISHKGGAGKTSSAVMLAEDLARRGHRVVLIDADRQRGAGLLLGLEQQSSAVQQTRNPRLRYFCGSSVPLRELPGKAQELAGLFDVAVIDTPSIDDPLARGWIQLSSDVLMVLPVEPVSLKTLDAAEGTLEGIRRLNGSIQLLGILPTMFDETDANQRSLMLELRSRRPEGLLSPPIPHDPGMAHRAEQNAERRTEPSEHTLQAYRAVGDLLVRALNLDGEYDARPAPAPRPEPAAAGWSAKPAPAAKPPSSAPTPPAPARRIPEPVVPPEVPLPVAAGASPLRWAVAVIAVIVVIALSVGLIIKFALPHSGGPASSSAGYGAPVRAAAAPR